MNGLARTGGKYTKWFCLPCNQDILGDTEESTAFQHLRDPTHLQNAAALAVPSALCVHCAKWFPEKQLQQHKRKRTHGFNVSVRHGRIWECEICDKIMARECKNQHLGGIKHTKKAREAVTKTSAPQIPDFTVLDESNWRCMVCCKVMPVANKSSHLGGKKHLARALQPQDDVAVTTPTPITISEIELTALSTWECIICNVHMRFADKEQHLRGKKHQEVLESLELPIAVTSSSVTQSGQLEALIPEVQSKHLETSIPVTKYQQPGISTLEPLYRTPLGKWECILCSKTAVNKEIHLQTKFHKRIVQALIRLGSKSNTPAQCETSTSGSCFKSTPLGWECVICNTNVESGYTEAHSRGKGHQRVLKALECMGVSVTNFVPEPTSDQPASLGWECIICETEMALVAKEEHLRGKKHRRLVHQGQQNPTTTIDYSELIQTKPDFPTKAGFTSPTTGSGNIELDTGLPNPRGGRKPPVTIDYSGLIQSGAYPPTRSAWSGMMWYSPS